MSASNIFGRGFGERKIKKILDVYPDIVDKYTTKQNEKWRSKLLTVDGFDEISVDNFLSALPYFQKFYQNVSK